MAARAAPSAPKYADIEPPPGAGDSDAVSSAKPRHVISTRLALRHLRDLSYEEMVEVTGLPLGTVKNRLFRAREMMRKLLVERGITRN
ncbi:sigma factor-like helix-turn-helix DNA-binding protein [Leptolyngbya sp. 7M]|uniref:sigma factor-like helix-turn-helix DNA-binding protein n=1 Tax=Leptolyngbya sp. 7M TaxID=2812896 RepID=UPI001B8D3D8F|nr:sigma factor-like helix-turn-helix DNA-binding protein [Leptolyngbya sp. 7M]QYO67041.1 hypothetical protein JVX88_09640 [Leptolyngbya sp. 7M]